jgi:lipopolysaccharide export system protein LptC
MYSHIERRRTRVAGLRASRWLTWLSFTVALAMIGLLAYQAGSFKSLVPKMPSGERQAGIEVSSAAAEKEVTVSESRFTGFDKNQRAFSVTARNAVQDGNKTGRVRLIEVAAELKRKSGEEISISSQRALYDSETKTIDLEGDVTITSAQGYVAKMATARVKIDEHRLRSEVPVEVVYPSGIIRSNGMEFIDDGARILFFNGVKATFGGAGRKGSLQ